MTKNIVKVYINNDGSVKAYDNAPLFGYTNYANRIVLVTPWTLSGNRAIELVFQKGSTQITPKRTMVQDTTLFEKVDGVDWGVYVYDIVEPDINDIVVSGANTVKLQFRWIVPVTTTVDQETVIYDVFRASTLLDIPLNGGLPFDLAELTVSEVTYLSELISSIDSNKLQKDFSGLPGINDPSLDDFIAIRRGSVNYKLTLGQFRALVIGIEARVEQLEQWIDQDVSIGSNPHFAVPTVDGLTFRQNGNTATIDYDDALAINQTASHIADTSIHFLKTDVTKGDVGLGNVDNTSDLAKPISTATQTALNAKQDTLVSSTNIKTINSTTVLGSGNFDLIPASEKGQAGGVATLDAVTGKLPTSQLPTSALEFKGTFGSAQSTTGGDLPATGNVGDVYISDTNGYVSANANTTFQSGDKALWDGTKWVRNAANDSVTSVNNRTGAITLTAEDVGLENVTNESKATMFTNPTFTGTVTGVTASDVGLGNVTNDAQVTSVSGTAPIVSSGGTTPAISISEATTEAAGSMSATDKAKLDALAAATLDTDTTNFDGILSEDEDTVQKALDVLDDIDASDIPFDNDGLNLIATDVQAALAEIDDLVEEGLTQIVVVKYEITDADDTAGGFIYNRNDETGINGTKDNGKFVFALPTGIEYVTGGNRLSVKIDGSDGALKRLFYGADDELVEVSGNIFAIDFALVDNDVLYAKLYQSLATVSLDIADGSVTESKIANGAVTTNKIANNAVDLTKVQQIPTNTILGNNTANTATTKALTVSETKTLLAINNVDNTSDLNKPISSNTQTALDLKADKTNVLEKDNTTSFTPTTDFHPATKKYVDDTVTGQGFITSAAIATLTDVDLTGLEDGQTLVYDETSGDWLPGLAGGGASVTISATPPSEPEIGDLWFDSSIGALFIYFDDGDSIQWVEVTYEQDYATTSNLTTTIDVSDWTGSEAPYTAVKTVSGLLSTDRPIVDLDLSAVAIGNVAAKQADWALVYRAAATDTDELSFFATEEPTESLVVQIKVVR
jgi:hypothetical protein